MTRPIEVQVTQEDINRGVRGHTTRCPVALALQRIYPKAFVGTSYWKPDGLGPHESFYLRESVQRFTNDFDSGKHVEPTTLVIEGPNA